MILLELFDRPSKTDILVQRPDKFKAEAEIGNRFISFVAEKEVAHEDIWDVVFYETESDEVRAKANYNLTGSGNEIEVMSTIKNLMSEFFQLYNPEQVSFSSNDKESSRTSLYSRMIEKFVPRNYKVSKGTSSDSMGSSTTFIIRRIK